MQYVCTCGAVDNRTQHFGYDTVALPTTLLCSHRLLQMQRFLLPLVRRDVAERPLRNADKIALKGLLGNVFQEEKNRRVSDAAAANIGD